MRTLAFFVGTLVVAAVSHGGSTILFTNDTHAHLDDGNITFSQIAAYRAELEKLGEEPILVDCGDVVQGTAFAKIDRAVPLIEIMNATGYQAATLGNHEFDLGLPAAIERATKISRFPVVACNFWQVTNLLSNVRVQVLPSYTVVTTRTSRIAFVGVATPESITSSTPKNFMDETGSYYLYGFNGGHDGKDLYQKVQRAVNRAAKDANAVIVLSHLGLGKVAGPWTSADLIANTTNFVALLDGHSHTFADTNLLNAAGKPVRLCQSGCHLMSLGELRLENGTVAATTYHKSLGAKDAKVAALEQALAERVEAWLGEKLAVADVDLYRYLPERDSCGETGLGDLVADAYYWYVNTYVEGGCDVAFNNYSGIRSNVKKGDFKLRTASDVCPFGNGVCLIEATGREIREAIEWGARRYPRYEGGFFHVAGLKYAVATSVVSSVRSRDGIWTGGPRKGVYRVRDLEVYDRAAKRFVPLELEKTYRVAGCDYVLLNGGNGYEMLRECKVIDQRVQTDYLALGAYVKAFRKDAAGVAHINSSSSPLVALPGYLIDYASRSGAGRIVPTE